MMPPESPNLYGLHPNAEIGFLTTTSENLFRTVFEMQPRDAGASGGTTVTREDKVKQILDEIMEKLPEEFNMTEIMGKVEERTPYVIVAFQECERMNYLTNEIKRSLKELDLGLKVSYYYRADNKTEYLNIPNFLHSANVCRKQKRPVIVTQSFFRGIFIL